MKLTTHAPNTRDSGRECLLLRQCLDGGTINHPCSNRCPKTFRSEINVISETNFDDKIKQVQKELEESQQINLFLLIGILVALIGSFVWLFYKMDLLP